MLHRNEQDNADLATLFASLGDGTRLSLLRRLSREEGSSIARLASETRITRQAVTKHLQVLEKAGLVKSVRVGRESRYSCRAEALEAAKAFLDMVSWQWEGVLSRLRPQDDS